MRWVVMSTSPFGYRVRYVWHLYFILWLQGEVGGDLFTLLYGYRVNLVVTSWLYFMVTGEVGVTSLLHFMVTEWGGWLTIYFMPLEAWKLRNAMFGSWQEASIRLSLLVYPGDFIVTGQQCTDFDLWGQCITEAICFPAVADNKLHHSVTDRVLDK